MGSSTVLLNDDIASMAKLKDAPLKNLNDMLAPQNKPDLITVPDKVEIASITGIPEEHIVTRYVRIFK